MKGVAEEELSDPSEDEEHATKEMPTVLMVMPSLPEPCQPTINC